MSSILETGNNKAKCQQFTPDNLIETMLALANYTDDLMGKTVLENSFGAGNILKAIVIRYINSALKAGFDLNAVSQGLSRDIYGYELDKALYNKCLSELNGIVNQYSLPAVQWNLFNRDALAMEDDITFDYIIGNPPYISYNEMDPLSRKTLKETYESCSIGKYDYCYAFIELGINHLKESGKLVQLVPNNIYKNVFGQILRDKLKMHITSIYDYPDQRLFNNALTSVSLFLYEQDNISASVYYKNMTNNQEMDISRDALNSKWVFACNTSQKEALVKFGEVFHASISIFCLLVLLFFFIYLSPCAGAQVTV